MLTDHDRDLEEALAPLREARPATDAHALVARGAGEQRRHPPPRSRSRRRWPASLRRLRPRLVMAVATATVLAGAALAALPGRESAERPETASGLLRAAAALAADQPEPPAWAGFRYVKSIERWTSRPMSAPKANTPPHAIGEPFTIEKTTEFWVDRRWHGRMVTSAGKLVTGRVPEDRTGEHGLLAPYDGPFQYGDGPLGEVPLAELPTEPGRLYELLVAAYKDLRWAPAGGHWAKGHPTPAQQHYDVLHEVLLLLTDANVTAEQRGALIEVLARYEGVRALPEARDRLDREGRGVEIPVTPGFGPSENRGTVRVIFSPDTSEVLEWSENGYNPDWGWIPGQVHTYERTAHVAAIGDRP